MPELQGAFAEMLALSGGVRLAVCDRLSLCSSGISRHTQRALSIPLNKTPRQKNNYSLAAIQQLRQRWRKGRFVTQICFMVGLNCYYRILK